MQAHHFYLIAYIRISIELLSLFWRSNYVEFFVYWLSFINKKIDGTQARNKRTQASNASWLRSLPFWAKFAKLFFENLEK